MALDPSFIGRQYPPSEAYLVSREKIREFAGAIGADDAVHHDPAAAIKLGYPDVIAPPTFSVVVASPASGPLIEDPALGLDYSRVVHADQRFVFTRPIHAGDRLVCVCVAEDVMTRAGSDFLTIRSEISTEAGEPVVHVWTRLVARA
jgi:acyl dehydratase